MSKSKRRYDVPAVMRVLDALIAQDPGRRDRRAASGELECRYVEHGRPACLAAAVLDGLGVSMGLLKSLDRELKDGSVQLVGSRSPIRKRFTDSAWELLSALQWCNDYGLSWAEAKERVLDPGSRVGRRWGLYHRGGDVYIVPFGSIGRPWMEDLETHE